MTIVAAGPDSFGPESPVGGYDSGSCASNGSCSVWIDGNSSLQYLDVKGDFIKAVSLLAQHFSPGRLLVARSRVPASAARSAGDRLHGSVL